MRTFGHLSTPKGHACENIDRLILKQHRNARERSARVTRFESRFGINISNSSTK